MPTVVIVPRRDRSTLTGRECADLLGISHAHAYDLLRRDGALAGVQAIRLGRRVVIPKAPFLAALGLDHDPVGGARSVPGGAGTGRHAPRTA